MIRAQKVVNDHTFRLYTGRDLRSLDGESYIWLAACGCSLHLTPEEEAGYGVTAFRSSLTQPYRADAPALQAHG